MIKFDDENLNSIKSILKRYDLESSIRLFSGLLTIPSMDVYANRISILIHMLLENAKGKKKLHHTGMCSLLNKQLAKMIAYLEDPIEDVFTSNILTNQGNYIVFNGTTEASDYMLQTIIDTLSKTDIPEQCNELIRKSYALLKLSNEVAKRNDLNSWISDPVNPEVQITIPNMNTIKERATTISFFHEDLEELGINIDDLVQFVFPIEERDRISEESLGSSTLERYPMLKLKDRYLLVLPNAVGIAVLRYIMDKMMQYGYMESFFEAIIIQQMNQIQNDVLSVFKSQSILLNPLIEYNLNINAWLIRYDTGSYINIVLIHNMNPTDDVNYMNVVEYDEYRKTLLQDYMSTVIEYCKKQKDFKYGITLVVLGGVGRGYYLSIPETGDNWHASGIGISDLILLAAESKQAIFEYIKCIRQREWYMEKGVYFINVNGDINFYCYWKARNYSVIPNELRVDDSTNVLIQNDWVFPFRSMCKASIDQHMVQDGSGVYSRVLKYGKDSFFDSIRELPIFVSLDHLNRGVLAGVVETSRGSTWLIAKIRENDEWNRKTAYDIWMGVLQLFHKVTNEIENLIINAGRSAISIALNFKEIENHSEMDDLTSRSKPIIKYMNEHYAEIVYPKDYMNYFRKVENHGERFTIKPIVQALLNVHGFVTSADRQSILDNIVLRILPNTGARFFHLFKTYNPIETLQSLEKSEIVFISDVDYEFEKIYLSNINGNAKNAYTIDLKEKCQDYLHKFVDVIWENIHEQLNNVNRKELMERTLGYLENVYFDREHWRRTALAIKSLYHPQDHVNNIDSERESRRTSISTSARILMEMAVCECPIFGGRTISKWELDSILAKVAIMIQYANQSDAIYNDYSNPYIEVFRNGIHSIDMEYFRRIIIPFTNSIHEEEFEYSTKQYGALYSLGNRDDSDIYDYSEDFVKSFHTEYGLTPEDVFECTSELVDIAYEARSNIVIEDSSSLKSKIKKQRKISEESICAFFSTYTLFSRKSWKEVPEGYVNRDYYPWRYNRRLSIIYKPIIDMSSDTDKVIYGVYTIINSITNHISRAEGGYLPSTFYSSSSMKSYTGKMAHKRGDEFERITAEKIRSNGWDIKSPVNMTEVGGKQKQGNIDVLAWRIDRKEVLIIECKRLQLARSISEVANICRRFKGDAADELSKHLNRVEWIKNNPSNLENIVGFSPKKEQIKHYLVTNVLVPMQYISDLPIDNEQIVQLENFMSGSS
ncbi:MAG: hypothetical protein KAR44_04060 [Candidatus Aegiribacteria sp.]|nr:hypothetical protein [Candidatus Aegiribacteria sp.]